MTRTIVVSILIAIALVNATTARSQTRAKSVAVGDTAPDFTLVDHHGKNVTLSESKGKNPVVVVFYRGYW